MTSTDRDGGGVELRVWWIPQIPMDPFFYMVPTIESGETLIDALAKYDLFQFEQNIKPDFSNAGGMAWKHQEFTDNEWHDFDPEEEWEREEVADALLKARSESQ